MTDDIPEGVKAQAERTRRAQKTFEHFASNMEGMVNRVKPEAVSIEELPKDYRKTCSEYLDALRRANEEEAKLATECENFRGVIQGGALDLEDARTEILGRVARIRERTGC
jgi:hypothetical protein